MFQTNLRKLNKNVSDDISIVTRFTNGDDNNNEAHQKCAYDMFKLHMMIMIIIEHWTYNVIGVSCIRTRIEC